MTRLRRAASAAITVAVIVGVAASCGGEGPPPLPEAGSFAPGACQTLAPDLIATLRLTQADPGAPDEIKALARDLTPPQEKLYGRIGTAGEYAGDLERVTTAVGFLRLRVDSGTYDPALLTEVRTTARMLADRCT
ncbi:hypothetical protein MXD62_10970 [Frankia sp. Mgl5]|uniref:hypothetical protein n=1 Tax=Frankiaceae TaxID=74712 RepID=UPI0000540983|nr:hypothetical protein [Frankia sp. Mgl5]ABW16133.1 hypothetical protein Franean1_6799 [Frankia sp. EAN1pec]MCK9927685.1 hypothetical protein [Frankia sp. Mgl5]CAI7975920.1 conserved exported hypothetical protein [Frankia sp. Hr75.2]